MSSRADVLHSGHLSSFRSPARTRTKGGCARRTRPQGLELPKAEKVRALEASGGVAISIDSDTPPYEVLLIDGDGTLEHVDGMDPLYRGTVERYHDPAWNHDNRDFPGSLIG
jgi:hypothetical protein